MRTYYQFTLHVEQPDGQRFGQAFRVEANQAPQLSRYDLCSDSMTALVTGGVIEQGARRIDTERKQLAAEIAQEVTEGILKAIKHYDLRNGYDPTEAGRSACAPFQSEH